MGHGERAGEHVGGDVEDVDARLPEGEKDGQDDGGVESEEEFGFHCWGSESWWWVWRRRREASLTRAS